jgi:hypothetical protein
LKGGVYEHYSPFFYKYFSPPERSSEKFAVLSFLSVARDRVTFYGKESTEKRL